MAADVKVTISGDSKSLEKACDRVGAAAKDMAGDLDKAEGDAKKFAGAMDKAADATDASEGKFMGAADLLDGLGGAFGLPTEGATNMMRSFGDLSGGFTALGPMIGGMGSSLSALATGPVGLIIAGVGLLAAGIIALYKNSETFRDIVSAAFNAVKSVVGPVIDGIGKAVSWVTGLFGGAGDKSEEMSDEMRAAAEESQRKWDEWKTSVANSLDSILNPLQRARDNTKLSLAEIRTNLADNAGFYAGWINNLQLLTQRGFGDIAAYFHTLGPEAEKAVGEATKLTDKELGYLRSTINNTLNKAGKEAGQLLADGIGGQNYEQLGMSVGNRFISGWDKVFAPGTMGHTLATSTGGLIGLPKRQHGGPVTAGSPYIVGEQGPELFVPGMSGAIIPNGTGTGGGTTVIQLVLDGQVVTEVVHEGLLRKQRRTPLGIG
jgi:hypothetical protein